MVRVQAGVGESGNYCVMARVCGSRLSGRMKQVTEMNGGDWPHTKKHALNVTELYT